MRKRLAGLALQAAAIACMTLLSGNALAQNPDRILPRHPVLGAAATEAEGGIKLIAVRPGSAAARASLRVGDIVTAIGAAPVLTPSDFVATVKRQRAGTPVPFAFRRDGRSISVQVTLDPAPDEQDPGVTTLYRTVEVDGGLRRTLITLPKGIDGRRPGVLIVGGIGCYSNDNPTDPEDAYSRLAHDLSRRGFVVMRLEKSGVGDSEGPPCMTVDLQGEMRGYEAALTAFSHDRRVDPERIYLFGHSIGSVMAPRMAQMQPTAGVIVAEAIGRNWIEYELWNLRRQLVLGGEPAESVDTLLAEKEVCMHRLLIEKQPEAEIERTQPECKLHNLYPAPASYVQEAAALNVAEPWTKLSAPVLAVYGTGDFVTAEADHQRIVDIVNARHPGSAILKLVPGMDHHLATAGTPQQAYDMRVKRHGDAPYDGQLSATILGWLCEREHCVKG